MPIQLGVRLLVAVACVAGVVASLTARSSRMTQQKAFAVYIETNDARAALDLLNDSRRLNPDWAIEVGKARLTPGRGVEILRRAVEREPQNAELWVRLAQQQVLAGDREGARRSYARAREHWPLLPPDGPPPGV